MIFPGVVDVVTQPVVGFLVIASAGADGSHPNVGTGAREKFSTGTSPASSLADASAATAWR
jgi:hypothetical protein